jgi:hypothetical protein
MQYGFAPPVHGTWHELFLDTYPCGLATVAILSNPNRSVRAVGWAKAMVEDQFDETVGQRIAIARCFDAYFGIKSHPGEEHYRPHRPSGSDEMA